MNILVTLVPAIVAALLCALLTPAAARLALAVETVDRPGPRKIHNRPTAPLGGLAVIAQNDNRGCDA